MADTMISRRVLLCGAAALAPAFARRASAQGQRAGIPLVAMITSGGPRTSDEAFLAALRQLGYIEHQTVRIEARHYLGEPERCASLAAELAALKPAVIWGTSPYALSALKGATSSIPIVGVDLESDPVAAGFVASLARPGGNITGIFLDMPELAGKLLQLLKESLPRLSIVGALWDANIAELQFKAVQQAAPIAGFHIRSLPVRRVDDVVQAVAAAVRERVGALVVLTSPLTSMSRVRLAELLLKHRIPSISVFVTFAEAGGLLAYGPDFRGMMRQSAVFVDRILKGSRPAEMPVERPVRFELVMNLRTAKALKLSLSPLVLARLDRIIE